MISLPNIEVHTQIYNSANSVVYRGRTKPENRPIILKVLKQDYPSPNEIIRYKQEYEITRSLNLKGVIQVYRQLQYQRTLVMVLEDFEGESLEKWRYKLPQEFCPMPLVEFLQLAIKIAEILDSIHAASIIHKDINPSNIVFNRSTGTVKIIDFGIATRFARTNPSFKNPDVLEGTLAYISPEQTGRMNRMLDYRTDFYSLGVTFYELLTGQLPFVSKDALELVHSHIAVLPLPPHQVNAKIPSVVSDIIMKLMAKNASDRYQSAWGVLADLSECLHQLENKGKIEEFQLGASDISDKFQIPQKLYGREAEVETLLAAFEKLTASEAREVNEKPQSKIQNPKSKMELFLVAGYSGVGKSALVREIYKPITSERGYFIAGKFDQFRRNIPYSAFVSAFAGLMRQLLTESSASLQQWQEKIQTALGTNGQVIVDVIPEVELIVGKQPPVSEVGALEAQNRFNLVFQNFLRVFCSKEHPLVIFLDDLQWVDSASLKLIKLIMSDRSLKYLFLIGAYRNNEVNSTHQLAIALEELKQDSITINEITLAPLQLEAITSLIADTLHTDTASVQPLAKLVVDKTNGNPFFVNEFLKTLYAENLLSFDFKSRTWEWDITQIQAREITDNVVELMIGKLKQLPQSTQFLLSLAACIGTNFSLSILAIICEKLESLIFPDLIEAVNSGVILPTSELDDQLLIHDYKFLHDRVQQAAYTLIDDNQKQILHLQIGRQLLEKITEDLLPEKLFEIVDHLNISVRLVCDRSERDQIAKLNLQAAKKAKAATAYAAALKYLTTGIELLQLDSWEHQYNLTLALHEEATEAAYLCGDFDEMERWANVVVEKAKNILDKVKVYEVKIITCIAQTKILDAIAVGLQVLEKLGVSIPASPTELDTQNILEKTAASLKRKTMEELINLPAMTDAYKLAAMRILLRSISSAYQAATSLLPFIVCEQVNLSIDYGNAPSSAFAYAIYGLILSGTGNDVESAYQLGQLALGLVEQSGIKEFKCRTFHIVAVGTTHGKCHVKNAVSLLLQSHQSGMENGDFEYASYAAEDRCQYSYFCGTELTTLSREMTNYATVIAQLKQELTLNYQEIYRQTVFNLLGQAENPCRLVGEVYNEEIMLPVHLAANDITGLFYFYVNKLVLCYIFEELTQALENAAKAQQYAVGGVTGELSMPVFHFYDSLIQLAAYESVSASEQNNLLLKVTTNQEKMQQWAQHAPMNFQHKYDLVEAEKARVLGDILEAEEFYERAIKGACENEYIQEEALAYELAAKFYMARGRSKFASTYMKEAHYCYKRWGAISKVKDLETKYPELLTISSVARGILEKHTATASTTTNTRSDQALDLATVVKASQTISGEIVLDRLLAALMKILIENAGAQTGYLILETSGKLLIEASGQVDYVHSTSVQSNNISVLQSIPIDSSYVPVSIVNYVARTKDYVILNDATREGNFTGDPYIRKHQTKSILCVPLLNQGQLGGIIYLENNIMTNAFTLERLEVLKLLSAQAAISIKNAKLYSSILERERDLQSSERRLTQFLEAMPVGVFVVDGNGKSYYANSRAEQLLGKSIVPNATTEQFSEVYQSYFAGSDSLYPSDRTPIERALQGESISVDDVEIRRPDKIIPLEVWATPVYDEQGNIIYAIAAFQDITSRKQAEKLLDEYNRTLENQVAERTLELEQEIVVRKRAEEAAQSANQAKSTFLANMSHELRTPLNTILGFSQLLSRNSQLSNQSQEYLEIINRSGSHLLTLINQVLELSKIEAARITLQQDTFNLHRLLSDLQNMFQLKARDQGLYLYFDIAREVPQVVCTDEVKLRQVLINLLDNAIKFTTSGGVSVKVSAVSDNGQQKIHFEVCDTGLGIAADEFSQLFEAFVQTSTGIKSQQGTGLGLAIAQKFIQLMGGEIAVSSSVGYGSIFKFYICVFPVETQAIATPQLRRVKAIEPNQPNYRLLVVEDRPEGRQLLMKLLSSVGFEVQAACDGQQAIEVWQKYSPHLIFMDMRLPVMDGYEATKRIKSTPTGQNTIIVAVTASSLESERAVILAAGCDEYIRKPYQESDIFDTISKRLGVRYIYDEPATIPAETDAIATADLSALDADLVEKLHHFAIRVDGKQILKLVEQIPSSHANVKNAIAQLVDNFQFEEIISLTRQDKRSSKQ